MINEVVYADRQKINNKKKTIGLTYSKGINHVNNNANYFDKLGTDEMDQDNANTLEVPLKGGLISYNITDIKGTEVMHYFKKKWAQRQRVEIEVKNNEGNKENYELEMNNNEEREFINRFVYKVGMVIEAWISKNKMEDIPFSKISILPVDSTSNFNKVFVKKELSKLNINGLQCQVVDPQMIVKDVRNLQRDEDFIENNKKFFNSDFAVGKPEFGTINQRVDDIVSKNNALKTVNKNIEEINFIAKKLINFLNNNKKLNQLSQLQIRNLKNHFKHYVDLIRQCYKITYSSTVDNTEHSINNSKILNAIKYSKGPSIDERSSILWNMVKPYLRNEKSKVDGESYTVMPLCMWKRADFEIKKLRNSERLGIKNIYAVNANWTEEQIQSEINKIKGTILLIFDDNISGGATLSDVCLQCKNLGLENIIPITFGKMTESNGMGGLKLNTPENGYDFSTDNNLSIYSGEKKGKRQYIKKSNELTYYKELFYKTHNIDESFEPIDILWLDDIREPYSHFSKKNNTGNFIRNNNYYNNNIFNRYNPNFIWVKNLKEFQDYIINNGMPDMISFDHDLKPKNHIGEFENGEDVARWLVDYCNKNNIKLPWVYVHSANKNGGQNIKNILNINESKVVKLSQEKLNEMIKNSIFNFLNN